MVFKLGKEGVSRIRHDSLQGTHAGHLDAEEVNWTEVCPEQCVQTTATHISRFNAVEDVNFCFSGDGAWKVFGIRDMLDTTIRAGREWHSCRPICEHFARDRQNKPER